jgi:hypothetical protein
MLNPYFNNYLYQPTQNLLNDLVVEAIKSHGFDCHYLPRSIVNFNEILGEGENYNFSNTHVIECYLTNFENWGGQGDFMSKFGIQINDQAEFIVSRQRFEEELDGERELPQEADILYFPLSKSFFTIKHVDYDSEFWPHGNNYIYSLKCELFDMSGEIFDLSNTEIQTEIDIFPVTANSTFMPDDSEDFSDEEDTYIDSSEDNPYKF